MVTALYPGSFDPITYGHMDIVIRASKLLEKVYIAVVDTRSSKSLMFTTEERIQFCKEALYNVPNIEVISYTGLTVDVARNLGASVMVRGLRMGSDFDYEFELALNNQKLAADVDTMYLMASLDHIYMKSSLIKEIAAFDGEINHLVPNNVAVALRDKYRSRV
ncbi:MAG: pantetheine-phosphate adenylyltransferase [Dehalococcoidia bacterium]|nr:pantetheine-phosphate adenylyltransferase [Dehalococcoidia bacterium]